MIKNMIWIFIFVFSFLLIVVFVTGFIRSINIANVDGLDDSIDQELKIDGLEEDLFADKNSFNILVLGDSIGEGVGDEEGLGIGERYARLLRENNDVNIQVSNLSASGDKIEDLLRLIENNNTSEVIDNSDLIILSIGGNDMKQLLDEPDESVLIEYTELSIKYLEQLETILNTIKENNYSSQIAMIGLYNPYGNVVSDEKLRLFFDWNYQTQLLILQYDYSVYVPTYDLFKYNLEEYLTIDQFHPNDKGYEAIAKRLYDVLN